MPFGDRDPVPQYLEPCKLSYPVFELRDASKISRELWGYGSQFKKRGCFDFHEFSERC